MAKYKVDAEGVEALNAVASQVSEATDELVSLTNSLEGAAADNPEGLGPHVSSLESALGEINSAISSAKDPADEVSDALSSLAQKYQDIIDNDPFQ